ncbi:MAG: leucine-rich repeat protein, partial [Clostridia bacterium]|nr:leucine-rich repeat protein [Clostridia bacterium]
MKECPNCQASINDTAKFCRNCGFNVKKHGEENDFVFCEECGAKMLSDSTFCEECGARVINDSDIIENNTQSFDFSNLDEVTNLATDQLYEQNGLKVENGVLVEYIGKRRSVTIPGTIEEIFDGVFCGNQFISEVEIEEGVKIIGKNVFANCPCLTKISIPASCTKIYEGAFDGTNVDDFIITENNLETALFFVSEEERKVLLKYFLKTLINENGGKATIKEIKEFANRVLEEGAFREYDDKIVIDFEDKTVAKINDGVTSIGEWDR